MNRSDKMVLAIDIGGTFTKLGLVDKDGEILATRVFATGASDPFENFLKRLEKELAQLRAENSALKDQDIAAVGIGAPNANYKTGVMENPPNFKWGNRVPLVEALEKWFSAPIEITNDANAAALGEQRFGLARGMEHFVVLTLGTGLGSGIICHGKLVTGAGGMAGELGHVNVRADGRQCNCGLKGCLETYASVTGIKRTVFELLAERAEASELREVSYNDLTGKKISMAARNGDPIALEAFAQTAEILGSKMADTVAHLEPEAFILTGGLSHAGAILLDPLIAAMERNLFGSYKGKVEVHLSTTPSEDAVLGPAALAWNALEQS